MSRFARWIFIGLAAFGLVASALAYPSVGIYIPSSVVVGEGYTGSVDAWDDMGELQTLSVSRNGSYYGGASGWGWCTYLGVSISDAATTSGTVYYSAAVDSASYSAYGSASITILANNPPIGSYDAVSSSAPTYGSISASGWAADFETLPIGSVKYYIDGNYAGDATWGDNRPDVASAFGKPNWQYTGFHLSFSASGLGIGTHSLKIVAFDKQGLSADLGTKNFDVVNTPPTAAMSIKGATSGTVTANMGETVTITVSGSDVDGNLRAVNLWVHTPVTGWRNIRSDNSLNGGFVENGTTDNAINSGGANVGSLGAANRSFTISLDQGFGTYQFVTRSYDASGSASGSQQVNVQVDNRPPSAAISASATSIGIGSTVTFTVSGSDPDGNMINLNLDIVSPVSGYYQADAGPYTYNGTPPNNGAYGFAPAGSKSQACAITFPTPGTYQFRAAVADNIAGWYLAGYSAPVTITVTNTPPVNQSVTVGSTFVYGQAIPMSVRTTDINGDLVSQHIVVSNTNYTTTNWEGTDPYGWKWHHFMSVAAANGSDSTVSFNLRDDNFGQGTTFPVGTYHVTLNGQDSAPNYTYDASRIMATFTVTKATPTITWSPPAAITYGTALSATQLNATASVPGTFSYSPGLGATLGGGSQTLNVTFTPSDTANYNTATKSVALTVNQANQTITFANPGTKVSGDSFALGGSASSGLPLTYTVVSGPGTIVGNTLTVTGGGTLVVKASQGGNANYNPATDVSQSFLAMLPITPPTSANATIAYGQLWTPAYSGGTAGAGSFIFSVATQTNWGTAAWPGGSLSGVNTYSFHVGQKGNASYFGGTSDPNVGDIAVNFTPYTVTVTKATPSLTALAPQTLTYGTALTAGMLNVVASNPYSGSVAAPTGTITYSVAGYGAVTVGTVLPVGTGTWTVTASYPGDANYNAISTSATFTVTKGVLTITANNVSKVFGASNPTFSASYSGLVGGDTSSVVSGLSFSTTATITSAFGTYPITPSGATAANYTITYVNGTLTVGKATPVLKNGTFRTGALRAAGYALQSGDLNAIFVHPSNSGAAKPTGTVTYSVASATGSGASPTSGSVTVGTTLQVGNYTLRASYPGDGNYNATTADATYLVNVPGADADSDGLTDEQEDLLGTNKTAGPSQNSSANDTQIKVKVNNPR